MAPRKRTPRTGPGGLPGKAPAKKPFTPSGGAKRTRGRAVNRPLPARAGGGGAEPPPPPKKPKKGERSKK